MTNKYNKYKPSKIDWLDEIPEHWEEVRLRYVGYLYGGLSGKNANDFNQNGNENNKSFIPFTNIADNLVIDPDKLQEVVIQEDEKQNQVKEGDLFFLMSSENFDDVGHTALLKDDLEETYLNSFCKGFRIIDENVFPTFLNYHLHSKQLRHNLLTGANGFTRINLKIDKVKDLLVALPPKNEQTAIAKYLDQKTAEINELINQKERLLELYDEEKTAIINQAVTKGINPDVKMKDSGIDWLGEIPEHWEIKRLKYVAKINPSKNVENKNFPNNVVFLPMEKVQEDGRYDCEIKKPVNELWNGFTYFERGDILVAKITPCFENGKGAYLKNLETDFGFGSTEFHVLRAISIHPEYLFFITRFELFMKIGEAFMTGAAGQKRVSTNFISEFIFVFPPSLNEQHSIVQSINNKCNSINSKIENTKKLIELFNEYKSSLISEAVTGKMKVTQ
ncbi:MAG: restriction endonuclease subunit S [Bacteroidota bacterium]